jgi:hypothetical protein
MSGCESVVEASLHCREISLSFLSEAAFEVLPLVEMLKAHLEESRPVFQVQTFLRLCRAFEIDRLTVRGHLYLD